MVKNYIRQENKFFYCCIYISLFINIVNYCLYCMCMSGNDYHICYGLLYTYTYYIKIRYICIYVYLYMRINKSYLHVYHVCFIFINLLNFCLFFFYAHTYIGTNCIYEYTSIRMAVIWAAQRARFCIFEKFHAKKFNSKKKLEF